MNGKLWFRVFLMGLMMAALVLSGCEGDDGDDGVDGVAGADGQSAYELAVDNGFTGTEEEWLALLEGTAVPTTADPESCAVCHTSVEDIHAPADVSAVTVNSSSVDLAGDFVIDFDVTIDGLPKDGLTIRRAYVNYDDPTNPDLDPATDYVTTFVREQLYRWDRDLQGCVDLTNPAPGNYVATVASGPCTVGANIVPEGVITDGTYLIQLFDEFGALSTDERPTAIAANGTSQLRDIVTNEGCATCHGDFPAWSEKFKHYEVGGSACQICHSQYSRTTGYNFKDAAGDFIDPSVTGGIQAGANLTEYIHGIHNSHSMPDGVYYRTDEIDADATVEDRYSVGYPANMNNCVTCHTTDAQITTVAAQPVSYYLCMSCHTNWDGFGDAIPEGNFHRGADMNTDCMGCHANVSTLDEVSDFHDQILDSARSASIYRGVDISFANEDEVTLSVDSVTSNGSDVSFTWSASKAGVAVDPCNADVSAGPVYTGLGAYLAYAKGDDWVNEFVGSSPGQPMGAQNLFTSLTTTCAANVATTTGLVLDAEAVAYASKVLLAIGGKPEDQDTFIVGTTPTPLPYFVREPSPTYAFNAADGSPATQRRDAVDSLKCTGCHQGTLYQHGGDRVDNEQLCVICHNPSASDKNVRLDTFAIVDDLGNVNTEATYDGQTAETYDMRTMIHGIHGVNKRVKPWTIYRGRGIYAFAPAYVDGNDQAIDYPKPEGWPVAPDQTVYGSTNDSEIAHNWIVVHYPKPINDCAACHNDEAFEAPDQTKAVALTVDAGTDWPDQSDDIVIGPTAAACTACHFTAPVKTHATSDFGYKANVTKDEMLEKAAQ